MTTAVRPSRPLRESFGDDEPTRIMLQPPSSLSGLAMSSRAPGAVQASASASSPGRPKANKLALGAIGVVSAGLVIGLCALFTAHFASYAHLVKQTRGFVASSASQALAVAPVALPPAPPPPAAPPPPVTVEDRADAAIDRASINPMSGGFIDIPSTFASSDGAYDLVIHFHGHHQLVSESFEHAGLNAVVAIVNLGIGSSAYNNQFSYRSSLTAVLDRVQATLEKRGLRGARLRRLALSAFSAGYGAVRGVLSQPALAEQVDAVLLLDGIHTGFLPRDHRLDLERLMAFARFAEQAVSGKKLFSITHSEITPNGDYAGTHQSTDALLSLLNVERGPGAPAPSVPTVPAMVNVAELVPLVPLSEARSGAFHVRGYAGTQKADHIMHLAQMSETAVPDLVRFWRESPAS